MLRLLTILLTLAGTHAQGLIINPYVFGEPAQGTPILEENYEGANIPSPNCYDLAAWAVAGGGQTFTKNTTTPACGLASLQISGGSAGQYAYSTHTLTNTYNEVFLHVRFKILAAPAGDSDIVKLGVAANTTEGTGALVIQVTSGLALKVVSGGANATTVSTLAANTYYHIWARYNVDGTGYVKFNSVSAQPTDANNIATYTGGATTAVDYYYNTQEGGLTVNWDTVRLRTGTVGTIDCN